MSQRRDQEARPIANCPICAILNGEKENQNCARSLTPFTHRQALDPAFTSNSVVNTATGTEAAGLVSVGGIQPKDGGAGSGIV